MGNKNPEKTKQISILSVVVAGLIILMSIKIALAYIPLAPTTPGEPNLELSLTIWNTPRNSTGEPVLFYASYVYSTEEPVLNANCKLEIAQGTHEMTFNGQEYETTLTLGTGTYSYRINCNGDIEYQTLTVSEAPVCLEGEIRSCTVTGTSGICADGRSECGENNMWDECRQITFSTGTENQTTCSNNLDDDCDGTTDEEDSDCNTPPSFFDSGEITITAGEEMGFKMIVTDPDGPTLSSRHEQLPTGMISLQGVAEIDPEDQSRTLKEDFYWLPTENQTGIHEVKFYASDSLNQEVLHTYVFNVLVNGTESIPETTCQDGTNYGECSNNQPYYCSENGELTKISNICGCPNGYEAVNNDCRKESSGSSSSGSSSSGSSSSIVGTTIITSQENQSNNEECIEQWECTEYEECVNGEQERYCQDIKSCGTEENKPNLTKMCETTNLEQEEKKMIDEKKPFIKREVITTTPEEGIKITIVNNGDESYNDLILEVNKIIQPITATITPQSSKEITVDIPLKELLTAKTIEATLKNKEKVFSKETLTLKVKVEETTYVEVGTEKGTQVHFVINNEEETKKTGIEAEYIILKEGKNVYEDFAGPFVIEPKETITKSITVPARYLTPGEYEIKTTYFEKGTAYKTETTSFTYSKKSQFNYAPIIIIITIVLGILLLFIMIDMGYNKRNLSQEFKSMKETFVKK